MDTQSLTQHGAHPSEHNTYIRSSEPTGTNAPHTEQPSEPTGHKYLSEPRMGTNPQNQPGHTPLRSQPGRTHPSDPPRERTHTSEPTCTHSLQHPAREHGVLKASHAHAARDGPHRPPNPTQAHTHPEQPTRMHNPQPNTGAHLSEPHCENS